MEIAFSTRKKLLFTFTEGKKHTLMNELFILFSVNIPRGDEVEMAEAMVMYQPISIAFEVVDDFMHYKSGTYSSKDCKGSPTGNIYDG